MALDSTARFCSRCGAENPAADESVDGLEGGLVQDPDLLRNVVLQLQEGEMTLNDAVESLAGRAQAMDRPQLAEQLALLNAASGGGWLTADRPE